MDEEQVVDLLCAQAWKTVTQFAAACSRAHSAQLLPQWYTMLDGADLTPSAKLLLEVEPDLFHFRRTGVDSSGRATIACDLEDVDFLTQGLATMSPLHNGSPFWLLSTVDMFTTILHALDMQPLRAFAQLARTADVLSGRLYRCLTPGLGVPFKPAFRDHMGHCISLLNHFEEEQVGASAACMTRLMKALPILAVTQLGPAELCSHQASVSVANVSGALLAFAYLYKAARTTGQITGDWLDMEFVIRQQSQNGKFVCESREGFPGLARNYSRALGLKSKNIPRDGSVYVLPKALPDFKKLQSTNRAIKAGSQLCAEVSDNTSELKTICDDRVNRFIYRLADLHNPGKAKGQNHGRPAEDLLEAIKAVRTEDELGTYFDYPGLWRRCADTLQKIHHSLRDHFEPFNIEPGNAECYEIVYYILWDAALTKAKSKRPTILSRLTSTIQAIINTEGDKWLKQAHTMSSGHLAESAKPCNNWPWIESEFVQRIGDPVRESEFAIAKASEQYFLKVLKNDASLTVAQKSARMRAWFEFEYEKEGFGRKISSFAMDAGGALRVEMYIDSATFLKVHQDGTFEIRVAGKLGGTLLDCVQTTVKRFLTQVMWDAIHLTEEREKYALFLCLNDSMALARWVFGEEKKIAKDDDVVILARRLLWGWARSAGLISHDGSQIVEPSDMSTDGMVGRRGLLVGTEKYKLQKVARFDKE